MTQLPAGDATWEAHFSLETGVEPATAFTLLERKGFGHPDTLADHFAEELSRAYSRWTLEEFGAVLHRNFDKLGLLGGRRRSGTAEVGSCSRSGS